MRRFATHASKAAFFMVGIVALLTIGASASATGATGSVGAWTTSPNHLPLDVSGSASATVDDYVYIIGGSSSTGGTWLDTVYYAKLGSDGSVGSWTASSHPIPVGVYYPSATAANGYLYVMGGYGGGMQNAVYYAKVNSDGSIGDWATSLNSLPVAAYEASAIVHDGYLYFVGGMDGDSHALNSVYYARLNSNGSVGSWTASTNLPQGIDDAAVTVANGRVYVMGGSSNSGFTNTVYHASFNSDGSVGSWITDSTTLPQALDGVTAAASNGYLYIAGGNTDVETTQDGVYYAKINTDGSVGSWTAGPALPQPLRYADSIIRGNHLYAIAGQNGGMTQSTVYYAHLNFISVQPTQSVPGILNSQPVTITGPIGTTISNFSAITPPASSSAAYSYPLGLTSFTLVTTSIENQITLTYQTELTPSQVVAQKYNSTTQTYSDIPGALITNTTLDGKHALQLTYLLTDGGSLDEDGAINGIIVDPVGLGRISSIVPLTAPSTGYGEPGGKTPALITALSVGAVAIGAVLRSIYRRGENATHR